MTKKEALRMVNESLIDQDEKFTREINALFKQKEMVELLQSAYDNSDENAKLSLMDATEKQFLDKFAANGSGDEKDADKDKKDEENKSEEGDFIADGSELTIDDEDGSDDDSSEDDSSDNDGAADNGGDSNAEGGDNESNPFADAFGGGDDTNSNPFESLRNRRGSKHLNESSKPSRIVRKNKQNVELNEGLEDWKKAALRAIVSGMVFLSAATGSDKLQARNVEWMNPNQTTEQTDTKSTYKEAEFPGGRDALLKLVAKNLRYPDVDATGRVWVKFVVDRNGTVTKVELQRSSANDALDAEALRVVKNLSYVKWKPALRDGKKVEETYCIPIVFRRTVKYM